MAYMQAPSFRKDGYHCPDHFSLERHHPMLLAAWATGLLTLVIALTVLGTRLRADQQTRSSPLEASATSARIR
jgi:hypothetical protein